MERNRDARRGAVAVVNGGGIGGVSRRRHRNSSRDSPDGDAVMEMPETARLRDRGGGGGKKDRDRFGRSKRRRGERMLHGSSNRDDGDESSEDSLDDEDDDEEDDVTVRFPLPSHPPAANPSSSSSPQQHQQQPSHHHHHHHHHHQHHSQPHQPPPQQQRKIFPPKVFKPPLVWKADEMIGVAVPRKARSAVKRSHECWVSGGAGGLGGGEQVPRPASTSPSRLSQASASQISPSSSNASLRKKMKFTSGGSKQRPPKISKAPSSSVIQDDIEIEVAEVLFGMTRQQFYPPKQETHKVDTKELDGDTVNEARSRVSSPASPARNPLAPPPPNSTFHPPVPANAPKRKKPRPIKFEDESPTSSPAGHAVPNSSMSSSMKFDGQNLIKTEASSPRSEQNRASHVVENGDSNAAEIAALQTEAAQSDEQQEAAKLERDQVQDLKMSTNPIIKAHIDCKDEAAFATEATLCTNLDVKLNEATALNKQDADCPRQEKFSIDLMDPPPGKLSPDGGNGCKFDSDQKSAIPEAEMVTIPSTQDKNQEMLLVEQAASRDYDLMDKSFSEKQMVKEHSMNLRFDLKKANKDDGNGKLQVQKQHQKAPKLEPKQEKCAPTAAVNMPMAVGAWPGGFPHFGYMGQVPTLQGVIPVDGSAGTANAFLPPFMTHQSRQKRCAKHFFIAQAIHNYQKLGSMNPFWSAATTNAIFGAKPYIMPHSDAALYTNPLQASFPGRNMGSLHDTKISPVGGAAYTGYTSTDKMATTNAPMTEVAQKKQVILQQAPHSGSTTNMLHTPAFIFPINQQQAAAVTPTANKTVSTKSTTGPGNLMTPAGASSSAGSSGSNGTVTQMNLNFTGLPTGDAQYLAMMQSNPYHFPLPPHVAGSSPFPGTTPPQGMPYFFPSHMLHPSQIQPQQQQHAGPSQTPHASQNHQKTSTSSVSSSSQKHIQQSNLASGLVVAGTNSHGFPASNQKQHGQPQNARQGSEKGSEENPPASEGGASQVQKGMYGQSFSIANHHQNFSLMPSAAAATVVGSVGHGDKQVMSHQPQQKQNVKMDLTSPSTFTLPFTAYNGTGAVLHGLDFSSLSQNHAILQALPEAARHGYHQIVTASQVAQNKNHTTDDSKSLVRESVNATVTAEDKRKATADRKNAGSGLQNSFTFSKPGGEATIPISSVLNNNTMDNSSRTLNLIQSPTNVSRTVNQPLGCSVPTSSMAMGTTSIPSHQHQQQILQIQKQQQQHQLSSSRSKNSVSTNSSSVHSDHLAGSFTMSKFPQPPTGFPQTVMQDGSHQTQIKTLGRSAAPISVSSSTPPIVKSNHLVHQQVRSAHQPLPVQSHQTQISFGMNSVKVMPAAGQNFSGVGNPSVAAFAVGSPCNSISKSAGSSPRTLTSGKPAPSTTVVPHPQQSSSKAPTSSSTSKTFPAGSLPSILGHPQNTAGNSSSKLQQQQQLPQSLKQQPYPQAQFYFTNAYMQQPHPVQSNAATTAVPTGYYQKWQADQAIQQIPQQQLTPVLGSSAMLALCSSAPPVSGTSTVPAKAMAAAGGNATNTKAMSQANLLHPSQFTVAHSAASGSTHALVPDAFPYMSMPAISVKATVDQKPAAGSDNLNWQPEKRRGMCQNDCSLND